jgi:hypothetical protein
MPRWSALLVLPVVIVLGSLACSGRRESGRKQHLDFPAFTVDEGVYRAKPGWKLTRGAGKTIIAARQAGGPGVIITPCECALVTGGSCEQAHREGPNGDILEVWCVDYGCGFCVGGTAEPDNPLSAIRFNVVCIAGRKAGS